MNKEIIESKLQELEKIADSTIKQMQEIKEQIQQIRDIVWDKQSKKESSSMYKVLEGDKPSTIIRSRVGEILADKSFMQKEKEKHLDNPNLRGMVTKDELLSFPKVAKNVDAEYNKDINDYTWKAKADDGNIIVYGSRKYKIDNKDTNRLLTTYSQTNRGQRQADKVSSATNFNDPDFRGSANGIIPENQKNNNQESDKYQLERNKTEYKQRQDRGERGQSHRQINDLDFLRPATDIVSKNQENNNQESTKHKHTHKLRRNR